MSVDDGEQENRVRGVQAIEKPFDRGPDRFADGSAPGDERRDEEDRWFVALGFDEELNARRLHRPSRVRHKRSEIERLDVETLQMVKDRCADIGLSHAGLAANDQTRSEDSELLESCAHTCVSVRVWQAQKQCLGRLTLKHLLLLESAVNLDELGFFEHVNALDRREYLGERCLGVVKRVRQKRNKLRRKWSSCRGSRSSGRRDEVCEEGVNRSSASALRTSQAGSNALCWEMTKSRAVTEISSGLMSKRSFVL